MTNQVTSIEQSNRLLELGVQPEKASMAWAQCSGGWHLSVLPHYTASKEYIDRGISIPAFTVADLLGALPSHCLMPDGVWINMEIGKWENIWRLSYYQMASGSDEVLCGGAGRDYYLLIQSTRLIDLLFGAAEWLLYKKCELKI